MARMTYDSILALLRQRKKTLRLNELIDVLTALGFDVKRGSKGNHHTYDHPDISEFLGSNFDGAHGRNTELREAYVRNVIKVLVEYEVELREWEKQHE